MPPSYSVVSSSERVLTVRPERARTSSAGGAAVRPLHSPPSSSGSRSYHSGSVGSDGWTDLGGEEDDLDPGDSASGARQPATRRPASTSRPEPTRRHSSRRSVLQEQVDIAPDAPRRRSSRRHHSSRSSRHRHGESRRVPSDESSSTVASQDDYPHYSHHGSRYPAPSGYRNMPAPAPPQSHGGYAPSMTAPPGFADHYAAQQALVHMPPPHDAFAYPQSNPFSPQSQQGGPFSPMGSTTGASSYFATEPLAPPMPHHRPAGMPRPQSYMGPSSHYGSEMMSPYMSPGMPPYGPYAMLSGMPGYHPMAGWYPPMPNQPSPAPSAAKEDKREEKNEQIEALKALIQKQEEAHVAREKAMIKKAEEEAAAQAAAKAREEEEKKKKEEIAAASKKAKEDAEKKAEETAKKAKEEHEKKLKEAQSAKETAEKKQKEFEDEVAKLKPAPDTGKQIKFKDAVGRKFSFPFQLCKTWKGMETLIRQAFLHVDVIGDHVRAGHFDLTGPDGEIILPQVWDVCIQPDWEICMHMWPMEEEKKEEPAMLVDPFGHMGLADILGGGGLDPHKKPSTSKKKTGSGKKEKKPELVAMGAPPPPPPANYPPGLGMLPDHMGLDFLPPPPPKVKKASSSKKKESGFSAWLSGGSSAPRKKK